MSFLPSFTGADQRSIIHALDKSQAVIHFDTNGIILWANANFLGALGYTLEEIKGRHHRIFVDKIYAESEEYKQFWSDLRQGRFQASQYQRFGKHDKEVWIQASYNPLLDKSGKPYKIVKFASDISNSILKTRSSFDRVQALIYFGMDGTIQDANPNFLKATGYELAEIKGRHHSMFCDHTYSQSQQYKDFWAALNRGELQTGEFQRIAKHSRPLWLQASYTVKYDNNGKPCQVIKYANDITQHKQNNLETNQAINAVSIATQELTSAIGDISSSTSVARDAAQNVSTQADNGNLSMQRLLKSANSMGDVLRLIQDISDQINLLALNAAIEAARAGDLGRGFAVVADEVKRLASQAGSSTIKIAEEVKSIQGISDEVAHALTQIQMSVNSVVETTSTVAAAIEQQSAVTNGIASNMHKVNVLLNA